MTAQLAPGWRSEEAVPLSGVADGKGSKEKELSPGEYRTVLAEQRTLLAFIRTALAITAVYGNNWLAGALGGLVLIVGFMQYALGAHLILNGRLPSGVDVSRLLRLASFNSTMVGAVMLAIAIASVVYKASDTETTSAQNAAMMSALIE